MAVKKGILLTNDFELDISTIRDAGGLIVSGLQIGNVTLQNQKLIINASKGEIKEDPLMGVGLNAFIDSEDSNALMREIRSQLHRDGQKLISVSIKDKTIEIITSI